MNLRDVDELLRATGHGGLAAAVISLTGPIHSLPNARRQEEEAWKRAFRPLDDAVADRLELALWRTWLDSTGLPRRLAPDPADAAVLMKEAAAVLGRLPSQPIPLGRLAAETCGDAHALDEGRPLATLVLSALRALAGGPFTAETSAESRRATWASAGVHLDELSNTVLTLGLAADPATPLGSVLSSHTAAGEPACLTLRQLRRHSAAIKAGRVYLCENPVVIAAAADDLGPDCPALVCVNGQPKAAVWRLLTLLQEGGATFLYHGDFDWGGVDIATSLHARVGFIPWRFTTADYLAAPAGRPLGGRPRATPWDPSLSVSMINRAVRVEEELVIDDLVTDLSAG